MKNTEFFFAIICESQKSLKNLQRRINKYLVDKNEPKSQVLVIFMALDVTY